MKRLNVNPRDWMLQLLKRSPTHYSAIFIWPPLNKFSNIHSLLQIKTISAQSHNQIIARIWQWQHIFYAKHFKILYRFPVFKNLQQSDIALQPTLQLLLLLTPFYSAERVCSMLMPSQKCSQPASSASVKVWGVNLIYI